MITTNNAEYAEQLRLLRQHGMNVSDSIRHGAKQVVIEEYICVGYNYRMTDMQAAIGIEQMKKLDWMIARRRELAARYTAALAGHSWLIPPYIPEYAEPSFQSYAVTMTSAAPIGRNILMQRLLDAGIATRRGVMLSHLEPAHRNTSRQVDLTRSKQASDCSLILPLYPQMSDDELRRVVACLLAADLYKANA